MPSVARLGDPISCGDHIGHGSSNVFVNGIPATRVGIDLTVGHCYNPTPIATGSPTVFANGIGLARVGDPIIVHCCPSIPACHGGVVSGGSSNVFSD